MPNGSSFTAKVRKLPDLPPQHIGAPTQCVHIRMPNGTFSTATIYPLGHNQSWHSGTKVFVQIQNGTVFTGIFQQEHFPIPTAISAQMGDHS